MFQNMMYKEIEIYVDDVINKYKTQDDHVQDVRKLFERVQKYDIKLNPTKCAFGVPSKNFWVLLSVEGELNWLLPK